MTLGQKSWQPPPHQLGIAMNEVHVWRAYLDVEPRMLQRLRQTLSEEELKRAERFHFQRDSVRYSVARGVLRDILGRYLKTSAQAVALYYNQYGKPFLREATDEAILNFNVSHSHGIALYAITKSRTAGIDIELMREELAGLDIAEQFFSPAEIAHLRAAPLEQKTLAFFNCWTRKEAYIKARGEGLSIPLNSFTVPFNEINSTQIISTGNGLAENSLWSLFNLYPGESYAAALAVEGNITRLCNWQWSAPSA